MAIKNDIIAICGLVLCAFFSSSNQVLAQQVEQVVFPKSSDHLLISYSVHHEMLETNDPIPLLRIFGDGRVLVHRPDYMKRAGDYEMYFSEKELQDLSLQLIALQVMSFDKESVSQQTRHADIEARSRHQVSDNSRISLMFAPHGVKIRGRQHIDAVGRRQHRLDNVGPMARLYPMIKSIGDMSKIEKVLYSLVSSPRLTQLQ